MIKTLAALLLSAPLVVAQVGDVRFQTFHVDAGGHQDLKEYLSLSDDQVQQLQDLRRQQFERMQPSVQAMAEAQRALDEALKAPSPDPTVIGQLTLNLHKQRDVMPDAQNALREMALGILTSDQRSKLDALEEALRLQPTAQQAVSLNLLNPSYGPLPPPHIAWFDGSGNRTMSLVADAEGGKHNAVFIQRGSAGAVTITGSDASKVFLSPSP